LDDQHDLVALDGLAALILAGREVAGSLGSCFQVAQMKGM